MTKAMVLFLSASLALFAGNSTQVSNFSLYDQKGNLHQLFYYGDAAAIVLFVQGNGCPIARKALPELNEIRKTFEPEKVRFFMINSNPQDNRSSIRNEAEKYKIDLPILVDETQLVGESLGLTRTAEALVIDTNSWKIVYRGPVNDRIGYEAEKETAARTWLKDALKAHLAGTPIKYPKVPPKGCLISFAPKQKITYTDHVAPLLKQRCSECHSVGGIAPWAMTGYNMVRGWSPMIREVVRTRRMPPWQADPHIGKFNNALELSPEERRMLVHWVESGAPRGVGPDPLEKLPKKESGWALGEPDLVLTLKKQTIPASGVIDYRYLTLEVPLKEDRWVRAIDFKPGNLEVTHHAVVLILNADTQRLETRNFKEDIFASYVPGRGVEVLPEDTGRLLPAGSRLVVQMHYTATGREEVDTSSMGLYFYDEKPKHKLLMNAGWNYNIQIPPNAAHHVERAQHRFDRESILYSFWPHMHFRGKAMSYDLITPDGSKERLLSVPAYNFNWQRIYNLEEPRKIPAGSILRVTAVYDNSDRNPMNPDPSKTVYFGEQSFEEMLIGYFSYRLADTGPAPGEPSE